MSSGLFGQALYRLPSKCVGQGRSVKCLKGLRTSAASRLSTQEPEAKQQEQLPYFKTQETCPLKHDQRHLGRIYTVRNLSSLKNFFNSVFVVFARFESSKTKKSLQSKSETNDFRLVLLKTSCIILKTSLTIYEMEFL